MAVLAAGLPLFAMAPEAPAQETADPAALLADLAPGHYSLVVRGAVSAEGINLPADDGDIAVDDDAMMAGEADEKLVYTADSWASGADNRSGPYELTILLGDDYTEIPGAETGGVMVGLHMTRAVEPGSYDLNEAFIDVGPGAVPLAVLAAAGAADNSVSLMFSRDLQGTLVLESVDRAAATGHFTLRATEFEGEEVITASGAFNRVPYTPAATVDVSAEGETAVSGADFDTVSAEALTPGVAIRIAPHPDYGPEAILRLAEAPAERAYETGAGSPLMLSYRDEPASGTVTFTRVDGALGGEFALDAADGARLTGSFDYLRPN
jgi:hypothetical protein